MKVGLQMYSVRDEMASDPLGTTRQVLDMGYRYIEFANLSVGDTGIGFDANPDELRQTLTAAGGQAVSTHLWGLDDHSLDAILDYHRTLGTKYLVSKFFYDGLDDIIDLAKTYVRIGDKFRDAGVELLVHTSLLRSQGSRTDLDELLDRVPEELLSVELDTYWIHRSGLDPIELMKRHGERIRVIHQKDLPAHIDQPVNIVGALPEDAPIRPESYYYDPDLLAPDNFIEIGHGSLPLQATIDAANEFCKAEFLFVEQDFTALSELESVQRSLDAIKQRQGVTFGDD